MELEDSYKIPNISILLKSKIPKEGQPDRKYIKIDVIYIHTHTGEVVNITNLIGNWLTLDI